MGETRSILYLYPLKNSLLNPLLDLGAALVVNHLDTLAQVAVLVHQVQVAVVAHAHKLVLRPSHDGHVHVVGAGERRKKSGDGR